MDTISHALWGSGLFGYRKYSWVAIFFGVMPDLLSFGLLFIIRIFNGNLNYSGLPTLEGLLQLEPFPEWVFAMDNITHSFIIAFLIISAADPCIGALTAALIAKFLNLGFVLLIPSI